MYATHTGSGPAQVKYISSHINHNLYLEQVKHLLLPTGVKNTISMKPNIGIPVEYILDGMYM